MNYKVSTSVMALATAMCWTTFPVNADDLRESLAKAYVGNPTLQAQRAALRATDEGVARANSGWRPTVQGRMQVSKTRTSFDTASGFPTTTSRRDNYSVTLSQPIFDGLQTLYTKRGALSQVKAGREQLLSIEQGVLLDTVTAYMDVIRDNAVLDLNVNNVQVLKRQLEASQDRFRVGEITRTDVAQSEAALAGAVSTRIQAEATLAGSRARYSRVVGDLPGSLESPPPLPPFPASYDEALVIALNENPTVTAAEYTAEAAQNSIKQSKGALLPSLSASASASQNKSPNNFLGTGARLTQESLQLGMVLTIPFYQSGSEYSDIRRAKQIASQRRLEIFAAERQVSETMLTAWEQYRATVSSIESNREQVRANEIALDGVRQEAAVGSRTTLDVLDAEQALLNSRVNLARAERDEYVAGFALLSALGRLNAIALDLPVEIYDPSEYYNDVKWQFVGWGTE